MSHALPFTFLVSILSEQSYVTGMAFGRLDCQPLLGKSARAPPPQILRAGRHLVTGVFWLTLSISFQWFNTGELKKFYSFLAFLATLIVSQNIVVKY